MLDLIKIDSDDRLYRVPSLCGAFGMSTDSLIRVRPSSTTKWDDRNLLYIVDYLLLNTNEINLKIDEYTESCEQENNNESFTLGSIFLSVEKETFGIGGSCSWDEEHGLGFIVSSGEIVLIGEESCAFDLSDFVSITRKSRDPFERYFDESRYTVRSFTKRLQWLENLNSSQKTLVKKYIDDSENIGLPGLLALFIARLAEVSFDEDIPYTLECVEKDYDVKIDHLHVLANLQKYNRKAKSYSTKNPQSTFRGIGIQAKRKYMANLPVYNQELLISNPNGNLEVLSILVKRRYIPGS